MIPRQTICSDNTVRCILIMWSNQNHDSYSLRIDGITPAERMCKLEFVVNGKYRGISWSYGYFPWLPA